MGSSDLQVRHSEGHHSGRQSALRSVLDHTVAHEGTDAPVHPELVGYGMIASGITITVSILGLLLHHPSTLAHSGFFLILGTQAAGLGSALHTIAVPLLCIGLSLLGLGIYLRVEPRPRSAGWRHAVVGQTVCGGSSVLVSGTFAAIFIINFLFWLAIAVAFVGSAVFMLKVWAEG